MAIESFRVFVHMDCLAIELTYKGSDFRQTTKIISFGAPGLEHYIESLRLRGDDVTGEEMALAVLRQEEIRVPLKACDDDPPSASAGASTN
jgi:hypothetical protein